MYSNYQWSVADLDLQPDSSVWKAQFHIPDSCAFLAFKFIEAIPSGEQLYDNNDDNGFVYVTVDKNHKRLPGGELSWGIFRKPSLGKGIFDYYRKFNISNEAYQMWVSKEVKTFPQLMSKYFDCYMLAVQMRDSSRFEEEVSKKVPVFLRDPQTAEAQYLMVRNIYSIQLKNKAKADSMEAVIIATYPGGMADRAKAFNTAYRLPNDDYKITVLEKFLADFPAETVYSNSELEYQRFMYYNTFRLVANVYLARKEDQKFLALLPSMDFVSLNEVYRWNLHKAISLSLLPLDRMYLLSDSLIHLLLRKKDDQSFSDGIRNTPRQTATITQAQLNSKLALHIRLLRNMKRFAEAKPYLLKITPDELYADASLNEAHVTILDSTGESNKALSVLEMGVRQSAATNAMLDWLKKRYIAKNKSEQGFDAYLEALKSPAAVEEVKAELKTKLMNRNISLPDLSGLNGIKLTAADLKGKIVVIDFWATWCIPCKMAFPGMQLAVDKYAKDPTVNFYFIATTEHSKDYKKEVDKYIASSGFRFNVLFDGVNKKTGQQNLFFAPLAHEFSSSGIPRKIILKDGIMRYTAEGYGGSPSKLMDEISYVIEILKAEE
jgi:thiol-disulfide isomerase/thioredoxin